MVDVCGYVCYIRWMCVGMFVISGVCVWVCLLYQVDVCGYVCYIRWMCVGMFVISGGCLSAIHSVSCLLTTRYLVY